MTPGFEDTAREVCRYLLAAGTASTPVSDFDDDWSPAGETYREELLESGFIGLIPEDREKGTEAALFLTMTGLEYANG